MGIVRYNKLETILKNWKDESKAKHIIQYKYYKGMLLICSSECGLLIGPVGDLVHKYRQILKEQISDFKDITFQDVDATYI